MISNNLGYIGSRVGSYMYLKELADASVDLVTCCQAIHWFDDIPAFYAEVGLFIRSVTFVWMNDVHSFSFIT